ncbi:class I adenylate-forming enzyme family protein [Cognatishimia sp. F0-27]|uniref:class I adenylate-forming enzyme family protein n=1 Tax=Cognatishimia sp. F0-27 TaxID=2816855 RepID=UPI001D0BFEFA|nr:class I adenylate-forming enzyme family protein [Cognatishimia sp. F0-27]MCC1493638.1 acyl--CoA ligase [Cognatishimia sp. F0-27]
MSARWHGLLEPQLAQRPDAPALRDTSGAAWRWVDLDAAVTEMADLLAASGVQQGDRVLIIAENCAAVVAAFYACSRLGAAAVPVNARQTAAEVDRVIAHARPAAILATDHVSQNAADHAERLGAAPVSGRFGTLAFRAARGDPEGAGDVAAILYTTGTTGTPKGVMLTHDNVRTGGRLSAELRGMRPEDLVYGVLPISHVFGLASVVTAATHAGAPVQLEARFSAAALYEALRAGVTLFSGVPQMHALLMQYTRERGYDTVPSDSLRYVSSGAAPLDPAWKRKAEAFYGVPLQNGYGMTETTAGVSATRNALGDPDTSVGPALPGLEVRIDEAVQGGGGGIGEILTRGPHVMKGYFRDPEATRAVLDAQGWMHTGDIGRLDEAGRLHVLGRSKELIIHGGFNVFPPEVEAALNDHPEVIQSAVIGRRQAGDEDVLAFCQVAPGSAVTPEALRAFAAERLAGYKLPARIVLADALPAAPTGKILKHRLLETFAAQLG